MCGIFGIRNLVKGESIDERPIIKSLQSMAHRGPDNLAKKKIDDNTILGHIRLSIIDLDERSNQPFSDESDNYCLVFNGEIFNYVEIKEDLINLGHEFITSSDTEVLLRSYIEWGYECVKKFNGMWAFALYDKKNDRVFCSRDRFGIKPFNYTLFNNTFVFASEIKAIITIYPELKKPNYNLIANFCRSSTGAQIKETWFENILRLEPAHNLVIENGSIQINRYWDYPRSIDKKINFEEAKLKYRSIFLDAVKLRMRSDVPVGFTLSSGIDSSSIVSVLKSNLNNNNKTYTASFSNNSFSNSEKQNFKNDIEINEPDLVRKLASELTLNSSFIEVDYNDYVCRMSKIIWHLESGHGSPAVYPLYSVLERARKDVVVVLEGQGADELLAGYISNVLPVYVKNLLLKLRFKTAYKEVKSFAQVYSLKSSFMLFFRDLNLNWLQKMYYKISGIDSFYCGKIKSYTHVKDYPIRPIGFDCSLNSYLYKSHTSGLVNLLHYGDAISMAHSIESRLPFMDYRLVEFVFSLPPEFKIKNGVGKYIHREAMRDIVPDFILSNPVKFGFDSPLVHIFKMEGENSPSSILLSKRCLNRGLFSESAIKKALEDQNRGKKNNSRFLFRMLSTELWFREFID